MVFKIQNIRTGISAFFKRHFRVIIAGAFVLLFAQGVFNLFWMKHAGKTAYINTETVYNSFDLKKKMELQLNTVEQQRQCMLDSLKFQLDMMYSHMQGNKKEDTTEETVFQNLRTEYFNKQEDFRQSNEALAQQYTTQIWSQLNQYLQDYGKQKNYQYIFGANGDGALMFADDAVNITDDVQTYVNERYKGQP